MKTAVIKYHHSKEPKRKYSSFFLLRQVKSLLYFIFKILTFWIPKASPDYERQLEQVDYWYIEIETETGIPQREIGFDILNSAILFGPTDRNYGFWTESNMTFDINQHPSIAAEVFNDVFEALELHSLSFVSQKIEKYFGKWTENNSIETPQLPLLFYDLTNYNETFYCDSWELLADVDLIGYRWDSSKRVIDAKGNVYKTTYINFGHPVGCVYPEKIEETISLENFKKILVTNFKEIRDKDLKEKTFAELFSKFK